MSAPAVLAALSSPYKGLAPFDDSDLDALLFFGRAHETEIVTANVLASRLTVLYGPSGVGKSSLLRAGVVRSLRAAGEPEPAVAVYGSWAGDPLAGLEEAVRAAVVEAIGREPAEAPGSLADRLAGWTAELGAELCLLLDQLEELFLYHPAERGAAGFVELLPELVGRPGLRVNVLLGIRDDAVAGLDVFKERIPGLFANSLRLDHLDREAAREAILGPLERYNELGPDGEVAIEPRLVDAVLDDVATGRIEPRFAGRGAGNGIRPATAARIETPYLQLVMQRVWEVERERGSSLLRVSTLRELGGAERIVDTHLQRALGALTPSQQDAAANVFGHLVTPSGMKIAHGVTDLASYAALEQSELEPVLRSLAHERVLRPLGENGHAAGGRYEIFHDVLAQAVVAWRNRHDAEAALTRERETARRRHRRLLAVTAAALLALAVMAALTAYAFSQRSEAKEQAAIAAKRQTLAVRLKVAAQRSAQQAREQAQKATQAQQDAVDAAAVAEAERERADQKAADAEAAEAEATEQAALAQSNEARANESAETARRARTEAEQAAADARDAEQKAKSQAAIAESRQKEALRQKRIAEARELAQEAFALLTVDPEESLELALQAARQFPNDVLIEDALRQALVESRVRLVLPANARVTAATFSPNGKRVVAASDDGAARVYDVQGDRRRVLHVLRHRKSVLAASFDPTGKHLVTASRDESAAIWSATTGELEHALPHAGEVTSASFSSDGGLVVTSSLDGAVRIWNVDGRILRTIPVDGSARAALFSPDAAMVAAVVEARDGRLTARVFDASSGRLLHQPNQRGIKDVAFSPDGSILATASTDRTTKLWKARSGERLHELAQPEGQITSAEFSPDGRLIATASQGGTAAVWNVATGSRLNVLGGAENFVQSASFSPDGRFVVVASLDRTARVYEVVNGRQMMLLAGHDDGVLDAEFSPDGRRVVTAGADGTARVWDPGTGNQLRVVGRHSGPVRTASFSRNGRVLLSAGDDGVARLWRAPYGPQLGALRHGRPITAAVLSPDGRLVATAAPLDGTVRVWSASSGTELLVLRASRPERALFSPDSQLLLTTEASGTARVWHTRDGALAATLANDRPLTAVAFSADGSRVAGGRADGSAAVWDVRTGARRRSLGGHKGRVVSVSFSRGDRRIVTASEDATARLWDARTGRLEWVLSGHTEPLTDARFNPAGDLVVTASRDRDARLWAVATGKSVHTLRAHFGSVLTASFSADGRWIVTAGPTTAGLWRSPTGRFLGFLRGPTNTLTSASFSPRGHRIVTSSLDGTVRLYGCEVCSDTEGLKPLARTRLDHARGR